MTSVLTRRWRDARNAHTEKRPPEDAVRRQPSASQWERPLEKTNLPISCSCTSSTQNWKNKSSVVEPLSLWYFVMVDWANEHSHLCTIKPIQRWFFLGVFIPSWTAACVWETFKDEPGHSQSDSHYFIIRKKWSP